MTIELGRATLSTAEGSQVRFGDLIDRPTVVVVVRYYGCAPCRLTLHQLADRYPAIRAGGGMVVAVGPRAAYQARLLERSGIPFPLLLDPEHQIGEALGQHRQSLLRFVGDVAAWKRWLRAARRTRQGLITGGWWETPAVAVVDPSTRVTWSHLGRSIGDYPPIETVLAELAELTGKE